MLASLVLALWCGPASATGLRGLYLQMGAGLAPLERLPQGQVDVLLLAFARLCGPQQLAEDAATCDGQPPHSLTLHAPLRAFHTALQRRKAQEPGLQVLLSVGGWGGSDGFFPMAADPVARAAFVASAVRLLRELPALDGIDLDWEHPGDNGGSNGRQLGSPQDGAHFVALAQALRPALDALGRERGRPYRLSAALNVTPPVLQRLDLAALTAPMDWLFMMSYDFHGAWNRWIGHHAALHSGAAGETSLASAVAQLRAAGVPPAKLVAGAAFYARAWQGVRRPVSNAPARGPAFNADGSLGWAALNACCLRPDGEGRAGYRRLHDAARQADALWSPSAGVFISYESPAALRAKRDWAAAQGLGGVFAWDWSHDDGRLLQALQPAPH